jgi:hypothetical protein
MAITTDTSRRLFIVVIDPFGETAGVMFGSADGALRRALEAFDEELRARGDSGFAECFGNATFVVAKSCGQINCLSLCCLARSCAGLILARGDTYNSLEMSIEVALVSEPGL